MEAIYHAGKAGMRASYFERLERIASEIGLSIAYKATRKVRGWPERSLKPWSLRYSDDTLLASFAKLDQLERNLRARAGC